MNTNNFNTGLKKLLTLDSIRLTKIGILIQHILLYAFFTFIIGLILNDIMPEYNKSKSKFIILIETLIHLTLLGFIIYYLRIIVMMFPFIIKINNFDSSKIDLSILYAEIIIIVIMVIATQMKLIKKINFLFRFLNDREIEVTYNNLDNQDKTLLLESLSKDQQSKNNLLNTTNDKTVEKFSSNQEIKHNENENEKKENQSFQTLISQIKNNIQALDNNSNAKFSSLNSLYNLPNNQSNQNMFLNTSLNTNENFSSVNNSYLPSIKVSEYFDNQNRLSQQQSFNQNTDIASPINTFDNRLSDSLLNNCPNKDSENFKSYKISNDYDNYDYNNNYNNNDYNHGFNETKQINFMGNKKNQIEDYFKSNSDSNNNETKVISLEKFKNTSLQTPSYDTLLKDIHRN